MTTPDPLHLVGVTLAHTYTVESLVRVDAGSVVYRATNLVTNRWIAVRVLNALEQVGAERRRALYDQLTRDRVKLDELAGIMLAAHPMRDVGAVGSAASGKLPWIALDWPHGVTLAHLMQSGHDTALPESIEEVVGLLEPIAVTLAIAHEHGVVHGGITADRILLREDELDGRRRGTLLDFGVARVLFAVEAKRDATPADDVRSLAALASRLLARSCGADATEGEDRTPRARGVVIADDVEGVFARAASHGSYSTVGEMWSELRRALRMGTLRSLEQTVPPDPPIYSSSRSLRPTARSTPPGPSGVDRGRAPSLLWTGSGVAIVALAAITFARASRNTPGSAAASVESCPIGMVAAGGAHVRLGEAGDADDPPHDATLRAFCIDREAVTTGAYEACAQRGNCPKASTTNEWDGITADDHAALDPLCTARDPGTHAQRPINCVSWAMAASFCADRGARLPTEAEWELASRTTSAGAAEWSSDWRAPIDPSASVDPQGPPAGDERVVRGAHAAGSSPTRFGAAPATRSHAIGFRCARSF